MYDPIGSEEIDKKMLLGFDDVGRREQPHETGMDDFLGKRRFRKRAPYGFGIGKRVPYKFGIGK